MKRGEAASSSLSSTSSSKSNIFICAISDDSVSLVEDEPLPEDEDGELIFLNFEGIFAQNAVDWIKYNEDK